MSSTSYIGIDFGTTNTSIVQIYNDEVGQKVKNLGENGDYPFSSIVAIPKNGDGEILFGRKVRAEQLELSQTHNIFVSMKTYLGTNKEFIAGDKVYTATEITAKFLGYVKNYIKEVHNVDINKATFSLPNDFTPQARRELKKAAVLAGIEPAGFIGEATAAYIANMRECDASKVLVLDWGGGTFDVSLLEVSQNKIVELAVCGENVGGDDINLKIANLVHDEIMKIGDEKVPFDVMTLSRQDDLIRLCENAKIDFSTYNDDYPLTIQDYGKYGTKTINISYHFFKELVKKIILAKVLPTIEIALNRSGLTNDDIDNVIIVGGSSYIKPFATAMTNIFGLEKIIIPKNLQWSVAVGAGLMNKVGTKIKLNSTLGLLMSDYEIYPIFRKNEDGIGSETLPVEFVLTEDFQEATFIFVDELKNVYAKETVKTKGYFKEKLTLKAVITDEQIAKIKILSNAVSTQYEKEIEINKLMFYYDLTI